MGDMVSATDFVHRCCLLLSSHAMAMSTNWVRRISGTCDFCRFKVGCYIAEVLNLMRRCFFPDTMALPPKCAPARRASGIYDCLHLTLVGELRHIIQMMECNGVSCLFEYEIVVARHWKSRVIMRDLIAIDSTPTLSKRKAENREILPIGIFTKVKMTGILYVKGLQI